MSKSSLAVAGPPSGRGRVTASGNERHGHAQVATADDFRALFRRHPAGIAVIAAKELDGSYVGFTSTSVISVSVEPLLIAFSVMGASSSWPAIRDAELVTVSFLAEGQIGIATRFSTQGIDRFAAGGWRTLASGLPAIEGAAASLSARIVQRIAAGGSHLVIAAVETIDLAGQGSAPLIYFDKEYRAAAFPLATPLQPAPEFGEQLKRGDQE